MNSRQGRLLLAATLVVLAFMSPAAAATTSDDDCQEAAADCVAVGGWNFSLALGAGVRTNPVVHQSDIPLVVIPQFSYYGKHFFIDDLDAGVSFIDNDRMTLSLVASPGYDRVFFYRSDLQNIFVTGFSNLTTSGATSPPNNATPGTGNGSSQVPAAVKFPSRSRQITYLAGPEWTFKYGTMTGQVDVLHEITGHNHGDEVRAALGIPLPHAGGSWTTDFGITWKSAAIVNYYYGAPGIYEGGAALDPFVKLAFSRPLKGRWNLTAFVECEHLSNAIAASPIVNAHFVTTTYVGTVYAF